MGKHVVAVKSRDVTHAALLVPAALRGDYVAPALAYATVAAALVTRCGAGCTWLRAAAHH